MRVNEQYRIVPLPASIFAIDGGPLRAVRSAQRATVPPPFHIRHALIITIGGGGTDAPPSLWLTYTFSETLSS
jgi:hypothetical protein